MNQKRLDDCGRKRQYKTRHEARVRARRATGTHKGKLYFYRCPLCRWFHLTGTRPVSAEEYRKRKLVDRLSP